MRSPGDVERRLEAEMPAYRGTPASISLTALDPDEHPCDAARADHYEVSARYPAATGESLAILETALRAFPGVYATTRVRRGSGRPAAKVMFENPDWPVMRGTGRPGLYDTVCPQVLALIRDEQPQAEKLRRPIFRCAECGNGSRLRGVVKLNAFGSVGPDGVIEYYDDWAEDADDIIEEAVSCQVHGEGPVEKLVGGSYTSFMTNGEFTVALDA